MTAYSYQCIDCPVTSERSFPMGQAPDILVTSEHSPHTFRRIITAPAVHIAGGTSAGYVKR